MWLRNKGNTTLFAIRRVVRIPDTGRPSTIARDIIRHPAGSRAGITIHQPAELVSHSAAVPLSTSRGKAIDNHPRSCPNGSHVRSKGTAYKCPKDSRTWGTQSDRERLQRRKRSNCLGRALGDWLGGWAPGTSTREKHYIDPTVGSPAAYAYALLGWLLCCYRPRIRSGRRPLTTAIAQPCQRSAVILHAPIG